MAGKANHTTAMAVALKKAGIVPVAERLQQIAVDALAGGRNNQRAAENAVCAAVRNNAALLWELFAPYRMQAVRDLLADVSDEIRQAAPTRAAQPNKVTIPSGDAGLSHAELYERRNKERADYYSLRAATYSAARATGEYDQAVPEVALREELTRNAENRARLSAQSLAYQFTAAKLDGRPLGDHTPEEALAWCDKQETKVEWVRALCHGKPPGIPLSRWYDGHENEAEEIWIRVNSKESRERREVLRERVMRLWEDAKWQAAAMGADAQEELERDMDTLRSGRKSRPEAVAAMPL